MAVAVAAQAILMQVRPIRSLQVAAVVAVALMVVSMGPGAMVLALEVRPVQPLPPGAQGGQQVWVVLGAVHKMGPTATVHPAARAMGELGVWAVMVVALPEAAPAQEAAAGAVRPGAAPVVVVVVATAVAAAVVVVSMTQAAAGEEVSVPQVPHIQPPRTKA